MPLIAACSYPFARLFSIAKLQREENGKSQWEKRMRGFSRRAKSCRCVDVDVCTYDVTTDIPNAATPIRNSNSQNGLHDNTITEFEFHRAFREARLCTCFFLSLKEVSRDGCGNWHQFIPDILNAADSGLFFHHLSINTHFPP